ncbi:MAG: enoyl-CoA hydratase/isomerase family protein, partial [Candidatus Kryptoniota bacterium]
MNAFNSELVDQLYKAIEISKNDYRIRAIVITGNGNCFSAGADLKMFIDWDKSKRDSFASITKKFHRIIIDIRRLGKPVIAAINGIAYGVGFSLAMSCDLRIASNDARFKQAYTSIGLVPDGGWTLSVARQIGMAKTCELLLQDPVMEAEELLKLGLLNRIVTRDKLEDLSIQIANEASGKSLNAFALAKELVNKSIYYDLENQLEAEIKAIIEATVTDDFRKGITAFLKRRNS